MSHPLYNFFPREVSRKRKLIYTWQEFIDYIKRNNGYSQMLSTSLYGYKKVVDGTPIYNSAVIDKLLFDFDETPEYDPLIEARKFDEKNHTVKRIRIMSGGGIHIITRVKIATELKWPSMAIKGLRDHLAAGIMKDNAVGGYTAQHVRIINTFNAKRQRWCIPLTNDQFWDMTWEEIKELAKKPQPFDRYMITGWEVPDYIIDFDMEPIPEVDINVDLADIPVTEADLDKECMKIKPDAGNIDRFILISSLVEKAFSKKAITDYLEKILSPAKFQHSMYVEDQVTKIFDGNMVCFGCDRIKEMGKCKNNCKYEE